MSAHDLPRQYARAVERFGSLLAAIGEDDWRRPTPCEDWNVRELTSHVGDELQWTQPLLAGRTIAEVTPTLPTDPLGADPAAAWRALAAEATTAVAAADLGGTVHVSYGDEHTEEYVRQLLADLVIHAWDLARAMGQDERHDDELVHAVTTWFDPAREQQWRDAGAIADPVPVGDDADAQARLLARFGRDPSPETTLAVLIRYFDAFNRRDLDGLAALTSEDCVLDDTTPPDGHRHVGHVEVRAFFEELLAANAVMHVVIEEGIIARDRATYRSVFHWENDDGLGHVHAVDVLRVRDGQVAEIVSYVKG